MIGSNWLDFPTAAAELSGKVAAFNAGYARVAGLNYNVIASGATSRSRRYLAFLLRKFAEIPRWGLAGTPFGKRSVADERFKNPDHVSGACQMFGASVLRTLGLPTIKSGGSI